MTSERSPLSTTEVHCANCEACCCRLQVRLLTDTGVPDRYIASDKWGGETMAQLDDGWCEALDRNTLRCSIYAQRPLVCRLFETGSHECLIEREANL